MNQLMDKEDAETWLLLFTKLSGDFYMICRIWHGYTMHENADIYEALLRSEIFIDISEKKIQGYQGIDLLRRNLEDEVEFITIMWFDSLESVKIFAGEDYEAAVVPSGARRLLSRFDDRSAHYEVIERRAETI